MWLEETLFSCTYIRGKYKAISLTSKNVAYIVSKFQMF